FRPTETCGRNGNCAGDGIDGTHQAPHASLPFSALCSLLLGYVRLAHHNCGAGEEGRLIIRNVPSDHYTVAHADVPGGDLSGILQVFLIGGDAQKDGIVGKLHGKARSGIRLDGEAGRVGAYHCSHGPVKGVRRLAPSWRSQAHHQQALTKKGKNCSYIGLRMWPTGSDPHYQPPLKHGKRGSASPRPSPSLPVRFASW